MVKKNNISNGALAAAIILALVVVGLGITIVVMSCEMASDDDGKCKSSSECTKKMCKGQSGCCAECTDGTCEKGALGKGGCKIPEKTEEAMGMARNFPGPNQKLSVINKNF